MDAAPDVAVHDAVTMQCAQRRQQLRDEAEQRREKTEIKPMTKAEAEGLERVDNRAEQVRVVAQSLAFVGLGVRAVAAGMLGATNDPDASVVRKHTAACCHRRSWERGDLLSPSSTRSYNAVACCHRREFEAISGTEY